MADTEVGSKETGKVRNLKYRSWTDLQYQKFKIPNFI